MSIWRSIYDAVLETGARMSLRVMGRDRQGDEDRLTGQDDRDAIIARCHDLRRNSPVVAGCIGRLTDNVVGSKLHLQARTSDSEWNAEAERWLRTWARSCDISGRFSLTQVARHLISARLIDGDALLVLNASGLISYVEAERIRPATGEEVAFKTDRHGRVTAFRVCDRDAKDGSFKATGAARYVRDFIHVTHNSRADQVRGLPDLTPVANIITDIKEINDANLKKYKMGALAAWTLSGGGQLRGRNTQQRGAHSLASFKDGIIYELEPGQSLQAFQNNSPGGEYDPFVTIQLRLISMALGLPYEFLLMYFGGSTFASSKASLLQAYKTIESWQSWLWETAIYPLVAWRIAKAVADGELSAAPVDKYGRSEWDRWEWQRPATQWVDPQSAVQTEMQEVSIGAGTLGRVCASRGIDLEETLEARAKELKLVRDIAAKHGVNPMELSSIQIPGSTNPVTTKDAE